MKHLLILVTILLSFGSAYAQQENKSKIMLFYADWDPHCKLIKPEFESKLPMMLDSKVVEVVLVNSDKDRELIKRYNIAGFPTIILELASGKFLLYEGPRDMSSIAEFVNENIRH